MEKPTLDIEIRVALLESTVIQQNEAVNQRLSRIEDVLLEMHDKLDQHILSQAVAMAKAEANISANAKAIVDAKADAAHQISTINSKIAKASSFISTIVTAIIVSAFEFLKK